MGLTLLCIAAPPAVIFACVPSRGWEVCAAIMLYPMTLHAIWLITFTAIIVVPLIVGFGIAAAWAVAKQRLPGRGLLVRLIDMPLSISPIIAGIACLLLYGRQGLPGPRRSWAP